MAIRILFMGIRQTNAVGNRPTALYGPEDSDDDSLDDSGFDMRQAFDRLFSIEAGDNVINPTDISSNQEKAYNNLCSSMMEGQFKDQPPKRKLVESPSDDVQLSKRSKTCE